MQKDALIEKLFGETSPLNSYIEGQQAGTQAVLARQTLKWAFAQVKLNKEDTAKLEKIIDVVIMAGLFNKSQLDQTLDKLGLIERSKGSRGKGRAIDTSGLDF